MEDLLKEADFVRVRYNPWKRFGLFYAVCYVFAILCYIVQRFIAGEDAEGYLFAILIFVLPISFSFIMVFHKKENSNLSLGTIASALLALNGTCLLALVTIGIIDVGGIKDEEIIYIYRMGGVYFLLFILISIIILPIVRYKQKRVQSQKAM